MEVEVVIPWRAGCPHRQAALDWVTDRYRDRHPDWPIHLGCHIVGDPAPWIKAVAVDAAIRHVTADIVVIADADVWSDHLDQAVAAVTDGWAWAVPHDTVHRLTEQATEAVLAGGPLDGELDQVPYRGKAGGGITILPADTYRATPLDARFAGWGQEDESWAVALRCLAGDEWRPHGPPLWHLWHPPQERLDRRTGSHESRALWHRYYAARHRPDEMRQIIQEAACRSSTTSRCSSDAT